MPSPYWMKLYFEILDDPKMGMMPDWLWRHTIEIFLLAGENMKDGLLPPVTVMAWRLHLTEVKLSETLRALAEVGVVHETSDGWIVTNFVKRQTSESLERVRRYRDKRNRYSNANVTDDVTVVETPSSSSLTLNSLNLNSSVFALYEQNIGILTPLIADRLKDAEKDYPQEWIEEAFDVAIQNNARNWAYIQAILDRWKVDGFKADTRPRKNGKGNYRKNGGQERSSPEARQRFAEE